MGTGELIGQPNKMLGVTWCWSSNTPSRLRAAGTGISSGSVASLTPNGLTFTLPTYSLARVASFGLSNPVNNC